MATSDGHCPEKRDGSATSDPHRPEKRDVLAGWPDSVAGGQLDVPAVEAVLAAVRDDVAVPVADPPVLFVPGRRGHQVAGAAAVDAGDGRGRPEVVTRFMHRHPPGSSTVPVVVLVLVVLSALPEPLLVP